MTLRGITLLLLASSAALSASSGPLSAGASPAPARDAVVAPGSPHAARVIPDFGLTLNEDGDLAIMQADADRAVTERKIRAALDTLKGSGVRTITYQIGAGVLNYPTRVGSVWGWRTTAKEATDPVWKDRMAKLRPAAAAGLDSVRTAAEWAAANGVHFVPSYRMNDAHYCVDPQDNPLTGKFWVDHHERLEFGRPPVDSPLVENYKYLLDFSHPEVRAYRLAVMTEAIERYADTMAGFQLDFMRNPVLFPRDGVAAGTPLITEMIAAVRSKLRGLEAKNGRTYVLWVRVPPTIEHAKKAGLDVERWLSEGLVDVVTPSPAMTLSYDMPVDRFAAAAAARSGGAVVYPAVLDRTQFAWPFTFDPTPAFYANATGNEPSPAMHRGFANNARRMGAAGVELYNYNVPLSRGDAAGVAALLAPMDGERVYGITPHYWIDTTDAFEPVKQLPVTLRPSRPARLTLVVGEDLSGGRVEAALRLGVAHADAAGRIGRIEVRVDGSPVYDGPAGAIATPVAGVPAGRGIKNHPPVTRTYLQARVGEPGVFRPGRNTIDLVIGGGGGGRDVVVGEVQLGVRDIERSSSTGR